LESASTHPLARAIVVRARDRGIAIAPATDILTERGRGVQGRVNGDLVFAGNEAYASAHGVHADGLSQSQNTRVFVGGARGLYGAIDLGDPVREESSRAVSRLQRDRIGVQIVSGDAEFPTRALAETLQISKWYAQATPERKAQIVSELRERGERVAFVGDGINDAPALASADVGLAMGGGTEIALETAHVAVISNDPRAVATGIELSRATLRTIKQNLFWAFAYNVVLVPLAAIGIVQPIFAAAAMGASSLFVVGNSLLLQRKHG
jgi:Cu+-exporting ATPase